jgi:NitT/TauT family transport system substrate-binding protein
MRRSLARPALLVALLALGAAGASVTGCKRQQPATSASAPASAPSAAAAPAGGEAAAARLDYGKPGDPVHLVVGFQPYYSEAWSALVVNGLELWKKYLPARSTVEFKVGLQGAIIVNAMLAGKNQIGYLGDMPAIVGATKRNVADLRIIANVGLSHDQCNVFLARNDAPAFADATAAVKWLDGKKVAVPKGSCTDRFARAVFKKQSINPGEYLNQNIELITSGFRGNKLDGAVVWEPTASRLVAEGLARRVASGNDFAENDGAFIDARADLVQQRPDVIKAWLRAELDAEQFLADPKNGQAVARLAKQQTTGFDEKILWQSLFGSYPASVGGAPSRLVVPFGFTATGLDLIKRSTSFLYEVKSINVAELPADAVQPQFTEEILRERGLTAPVGEIKASAEIAAK